MGINIHVYTYYGVKTGWDASFSDEHEIIEEALYDEFGYNNPRPADRQIDLLFDCMGATYIVFGYELYDSGDFRWNDDMNDFKELDISNLEQMKADYIEKFNRLYPAHTHLLEGKEWKLMNLIHYT